MLHILITYKYRSGERKNYVVISYDPTEGTHCVQRIKVTTDKKKGKNFDYDYNHKRKNINMRDLPNICWLDITNFTKARPKEKLLYSSRYAGVEYFMSDNGLSSWKAFAPKSKTDNGLAKFVGVYSTERDAALAHDCYARMVGCKKLNFYNESLSSEDAKKLRTSSAPLLPPSIANDGTTMATTTNSSNKTKRDVATAVKEKTKDENTSLRKTTSKYRGVSFVKNNMSTRPWIARVYLSSVLQNLHKSHKSAHVIGYYETEAEAALAYDEVVIKHGDDDDIKKCLNFPDKIPLIQSNKNKTAVKERNKDESTSLRKTTSKYRGVSFIKNMSKRPWRAKVYLSSVLQNLHKSHKSEHVIGHYETEAEAALAYDEVVIKHGDGDDIKKCLNFPDKIPLIQSNKNKNYKRKLELQEQITDKKQRKLPSDDLSLLSIGDRIAFDFGSGIYFGGIEKCSTDAIDKSKWSWNVLFDDGDFYNFDHDDMLEGFSLYQNLKKKEMDDPLREEKIDKVKTDFMAQKNHVLSRIPPKVKKQFLQVGFALWQKSYLPVLFLGPYDVDPGLVRDKWLSAFDKVCFGS